MAVTITKDTIIGDILDIAPETAPLFMAIGMHCLGCPASRGETVEEACMVHGIDTDELLEELNKKGAQLLFSSHDLTTMKNTVFRRDEIWFAAMNDNHESEIYSLYEFRQEDNTRVKSTAAFDKQYLEGRYGADPYLSNMLTGRDWA